MKKFVAILLAIVLLCSCVACGKGNSATNVDNSSTPSSKVESSNEQEDGGVLYLKVNPEIAIHFNAHGEVTKIVAHNEDAKAIVNQYVGYKGKPCKTVVSELVVEIGKAGYFVTDSEETQNQITITIEGDIDLPDDSFLEDIEKEVNDTVDENDWDCPVNVEDKRPSSGSDKKEDKNDKDDKKDKNDKKEENKKPAQSTSSEPVSSTPSQPVESTPESTPSQPVESIPESTPVSSAPESSTPVHTHSYATATCTAAATCSCGDTKGESLGHNYSLSDGKCTRCLMKDAKFKALTDGVWMYMKKDEYNNYNNQTLDFANKGWYAKLMTEWSDLTEEDRNIYLTQYPNQFIEYQGKKYICGAGEDLQFSYVTQGETVKVSLYLEDDSGNKSTIGDVILKRKSNTELVVISSHNSDDIGKVFTWHSSYPFFIPYEEPDKALTDGYWIFIENLPDENFKNFHIINFRSGGLISGGMYRWSSYSKELQDSIGENSDSVDVWNGEKWHTGSGGGEMFEYSEQEDLISITISPTITITLKRTAPDELTIVDDAEYFFTSANGEKVVWSATYPFSKLITLA